MSLQPPRFNPSLAVVADAFASATVFALSQSMHTGSLEDMLSASRDDKCATSTRALEVRASVSTQLRFRHTDARRLGQSPADGLRLLPPAAASVDDARKCSACVAAGAADTRLPVGTLTPCAAVFIGQRAQGCSQLAARAAATTVKSLARGRYIFPRILNEKCCVKTLYYCNSPLAATRGICEQGELQTACCMAAGDAAHD